MVDLFICDKATECNDSCCEHITPHEKVGFPYDDCGGIYSINKQATCVPIRNLFHLDRVISVLQDYDLLTEDLTTTLTGLLLEEMQIVMNLVLKHLGQKLIMDGNKFSLIGADAPVGDIEVIDFSPEEK